MNLRDFFEVTTQHIAAGNMQALAKLHPPKPEYFNWVEDIFCPLYVEPYGSSDALIWKKGTEKAQYFSFNNMYRRSNRLVNMLRDKGIMQGNVIYTMLPLIPENWYSFLAGIKGGYILMPTATNLVTKDLVYRLETLFADAIIAHSDFAEEIDKAEKELGKTIKLKIIIGEAREGWVHFQQTDTYDPVCLASKTKADDPFLYFFTSGTTGLPKIVVHSHFTYPVGHLATLSWLGCKRGDIHYNISSPGWAKFAWSSFFAPWNAGATIFAFQSERFDAKEQLQTMQKMKVTTFCGSPTVIRMFIQEKLSDYKLPLRTACAAGEPLNPDVMEQWFQGTAVPIRDGYGQTETTALVGNLPKQEIRPGSMGKPTFLYDIGIYDDRGKEMPALEEGVICVKTKNTKNNGLFLEYLEDEERTAASFKNDLYYTGDKAYKDKDGYIWFVGRNDDVIKASAYRIGPFEVESVLIEHPAVVETAVVASPHELRGYAVKAFVILKEGVRANAALAQELFGFSEQKLAKYKVPRILEFVETLPKTISGKIRRVELRANEATAKAKKVKGKHEYFHKKY